MQFACIAQLRECCAAEGLPLISVDTKKRELVGQFKNTGASWEHRPVLVNDHDFRSQAEGVAIPYGIFVWNNGRKGSWYLFRAQICLLFRKLL